MTLRLRGVDVQICFLVTYHVLESDSLHDSSTRSRRLAFRVARRCFVLARERWATGFLGWCGANRQDLADSRGLCGVVLGRNSTLQGEPARLLVRAGRPLGRWACRIVEPETRARQSGVQLMFKTVLLYIRLSRSTKNLSAGETSDTLGGRVGMHQPKQKLSCTTTFVVW